MNNVFDTTNVDLYHILGLNPGEEDSAVIKKNFSDLIKVFHSDKGGDSLFHQQIVEAYRILSDKTKKFIYDNFGLVGVYSIKENDEMLKIYSEVVQSNVVTDEEKVKVKEYVLKKIYKRLGDSDLNEFPGSSEISSGFSTSLVDYFYTSSFEENKNMKIGKALTHNKLSFDNHVSLFEDNNRELNATYHCNVDPRNYSTEISYGADFSNRISLPYKVKLFGQNFIDTKIGFTNDITPTENDFTIYKSITLFNLLNFPINFTVTPHYSLYERSLTSLELVGDYLLSPNLSSQLKYNPVSKNIDLSLNCKMKKQNLIAMLSLGTNRFSLGAYYSSKISSRVSKSYSAFLRDKGLYFSNDSIVNWKSLAFKFTSSFNFIKSENNLKFNSNLQFGIQIKSFKIQFPILLSRESNILSHSLVLMSALFGEVFSYIRKRWKYKERHHVEIMNKINSYNLLQFNSTNAEIFNNRTNGIKPGDLEIRYAFLGEYSKIFQIYRSLLVFGRYRNDDNKIFDVKIALTLHINNYMLEIPENFLEIEGLYIPDYANKENLALVIHYSYLFCDYTVILKNDRNEFIIP